MRSSLYFVIAVVAFLFRTACAHCADLDYLAGIGDFEQCSATKWYTDYAGSDYDFYARPGAIRIDSTTRKGHYDPLPDDSVADGWSRVVVGCSGPTKWNSIRLGDVVCRISKGTGIQDTNCQHFAIRGTDSSEAVLSATLYLCGQSYAPSAGDKLVLRIDHLRFEDYNQVPIRFSVTLNCGAQSTRLVLSPSTAPASAEASLVLNGPALSVNVSIVIDAIGDLGNHQPGIYVDGAHLFVRRVGRSSNLSLEEAFPGTRGIRTIRTWYDTTDQSAVETAQDYDLVVLPASSYWLGAILKRVNPSIRVYCYQPVYAVDRRDMDGRSPYFPDTPIDYNTVMNHTEWLYAKPGGGYYADTNYAPPFLYVRFGDQSYRDAWTQGTISFAKKFGFDGVFVDTCADMQPPLSPPTVMPWEVQQFVHDVFPKLKAAGLDVIQNGAGRHRVRNPGEHWYQSGYVWHDINWIPTSSEVEQGCVPNSAAKLSNAHFQEMAFFSCASAVGVPNSYSADYWLKCIADMDAVKQWNTAKNAPLDKDKQSEHMMVWGRDVTGGGAYGIDGWLQFGLCSYLLAQNDWTAFGWAVREGKIDYREPISDLSITKTIGAPDGAHQPYNGDTYCRYRLYKADSSGGLGGVVVANGNTDSPRNYTLDFNATDESGNRVDVGAVVTLKPHTGRIFLRRSDSVDIKITAPMQGVSPGEVITVALNYTNKGSSEAKNVQLRVPVPDELDYVPGTAEQSGGYYDPATNSVYWVAATVAAGETGSRQFQARVK